MRQADSPEADLLALIEEGNQICKEIEEARAFAEASLSDRLDKWIEKVRQMAKARGCAGCSVTLSVAWPPRIDLAFQWTTP
jgi:hypothetical protein